MQLQSELLPHQTGQRAHADTRQLADGLDPVGHQPFLRLLPYPQEIPYGQRPHLGLNLAAPQGMYLVRLLKVRGHLGQELVGANAHVHRKAQRALDLFLQLSGLNDRIFRRAAQAHIDEALIDGELLQHRRIRSANGNKAIRALFVPRPVSPDDDQLRTLPECHRDGFGNTDAQLLGRNGRGRDNAPPVGRIPRHHRGNQPDIRLPLPYQLGGRPAHKGTVDVDMKNNPGQEA